ncbi:MAG TPA: hydrogenase expression/formation protein HypE [Vicinamibacteria bacterium]|nr:hydrogenase expression/formation protein HypE [Vicinamibacteria bacterium]
MPVLDHERILLGHGSGGVLTSQLVEGVFLPAFANPVLQRLEDQAVVEIPGSRLAFTTDSFVVTPLFFPGGDIGRLAVHGTVNDLAVSGARPLHLAAAFILEEGLPIEDLRRIVRSMREAAAQAGVSVVTGDTKVVGKGAADKVFINTSGIGVLPPGVELSADRARPGDAVLLSGTAGDHGMAIMAARESLGLEGAIASDSAPLHDLVQRMLAASGGVHALRDPTRGGVATVLQEIAARAGVGIELTEDAVPVRDEVRGACEILGFDPLYVANEGKLVAFVEDGAAETVLAAMRAHPLGRDAARIGTATGEHPGLVVVRTAIGGSRVLERPYGELLPRIC